MMKAFFLVGVLQQLVSGVKVTISNVEPRRDTDGDIIAAGDGCISYHPDEQRYYLFGAHYQPCAEPDTDCYCGGAQGSGMGGCGQCESPGFVPEGACCGWRNATIASYSSPDLVTWRKEGLNILPILTEDPSSTFSSNHGAIFEACGIFNRNTGFWVLYFLRDGYVLANAVSRLASGPFNILNYAVPIPGFSRIVDHYYWQNATTGELVMKHNGNGGEFACKMADDYLSVGNCSAMFGHELGYTEGGGIFEYGGSSYVMAGFGCCFCTLGSNGYLWKSDTGPLGNYELQGDFIARNPDKSSVTHSQQFSVTPVYTATGAVPMFIGIRFGSSPEKIKSTDFQFWAPLTFDPTTGRMNNVTWVDSFELDLEPPPPPPPIPSPPPPAFFACSLQAPGQCVEVPNGAPGSNATLEECETACKPWYACGDTPGTCNPVASQTPNAFPSLTQCTNSCVPCNLAGLWYGNLPTVDVHIENTGVGTSHVNIYTIPPREWTSNATGTVGLGEIQISGGWCGAGKCTGKVTPLEAGGPPCAKITWDAGVWCNPAVDQLCVR